MSNPPSAQLLQRIQEKQQELQQLLALRQLASHLQTHFDELSDKFDSINQGNLAVSKVLENWNDVFRTIDLTDRLAAQEQDQDPERSTLVRIPTA